ncbi:isopeptide-forming domain-containing fimbrial protein [Rhodococcus qingshengii]|uniref:DUF7927 domain-containing protein n=4 Tax=Rhodococcus TaxID=1827 RepID=UPI000B03E071|nr:isopeptide-forming domain-containing fimbrial protein [Rhodococcus qingshengii]
MPNDIPPTRSAIFTAGLPPWVRAWTVVWTAIAMILGISGATAVVASAQPAATLGGPVQAQAPARAAVLPDEQPAKGCAFSAPGTGPFSQNICWIDMSTLDAATAASAAGQSMEIQLTDGYKINFKAFLTDSVAGKTHQGIETKAFPTLHYAALGTSAYTGVPTTIKPAIYQTSATAGQSGGTVSLKNIVMTGPNGAVNNYGLVAADAESTDANINTTNDREFLTFNSDKPLRQIARTVGDDSDPAYPGIRACDGGLTGMPANTVRCDSWNNVNGQGRTPGTLVVASTAPTSFAATFGNTVQATSRQGLAFGVLLSKVKIDKDLTRVTPGDDFTIGMSTGHHADAGAAAATEIKSTTTGATDTTASTGWRTLLADTTPTPVTFWEKPTTSATKTANYATSWDCQVNGVTQALRVGDVAQAALTPGDNVYCKVKNTPVLVKKSSSPPTGETVNIGQSITYTLNFENPGTAPATIDYTDYLADVIDDGTVAVGAATGGLTAALNGADKIKVGGTLPAGGKGTVTYTVTVKDGGNKVLNNYLVPGTTTPPTTCDPATNLCTTHPMPGFTLTKTADPVSGSTVQAGDTITYTVTGANTGRTALTPATITDDLSAVLNNAAVVPGSLKATIDGAPVAAPTLSGSTLSWSANLPAGKSVVLTYQVKVNAGVAAGTVLNNKVTGTAKPPTGPEITPPPVTTEHPVKVPGFTVAKAADPASGTNVAAGQTITYTVTGANTGNTTLDPVVLTDDLSKVLDNAALVDGSLKATVDGVDRAAPSLAGTTLSWTGALEAGKSVVLTYQVKINDGVAGGTLINNKVTGTAKPPTGPEITPPPVTTEHPVLSPKIAVVKSSDPVSGSNVVAGQDIKYTLTFTNTGNGAGEVAYFDDLRQVVDKGALSGLAADAPLVATMVGSDGFSVTGTLAAGETKSVTYSVKVNADVVGGVFVNNFVVPGTTPPVDPPEVCDPVTQLCTTHPVKVPGFTVAKAADPASGTNVAAGQTITYTVTGANTGNTTLDPVVLTDDLSKVLDNAVLVDGSLKATVDGVDGAAPSLAGTTLSWTGALEAGKSVVLTYQVKVNAGVAGGTLINNKVTGTAKPPTGPEITPPPVTTEHPVKVPGFTVAKAADPASGTNVAAGQTITYTVTGANTGNTTLDPVVLTDDLSKVLDNAALVDGSLKATVDGVDGAAPSLAGTTLSWTGALEAGKSVVLTYQVKINDGVAGGTLINNKVTGTAKPPTGPEITPPPVTTEHPVLSPKIAVVKSSDPVSGSNVVAGQDIKYTLTFTNTGNGAGEVAHFDDLRGLLDDADLVAGSLSADAPLTAAMVGTDGFSVTGSLAAGETKTVTYTVTVKADADRVAANADNTVLNFVVPGTTPPVDPPEVCDPATQLCTTHPVKVPGFTVAKAADPVSGTNVAAGQTITYTVTGANTGNTTLDPVVLTDDLSKVLDNAALVDGSLKATVDGVDGAAPSLAGTTLTWTGGLEAGKSVVLTYQVKVNAGVAGGTLINNKVTGTAKPPTGPEITPPPVTTEHPVDGTPAIEVLKSSVPSTTNRVVGGQEITYTLTFKNVGTADGEISFYDDLTDVLDDAVMTKDPATTSTLVVSGVVDNVFTVTGKLAKGETATVTYTVKVNPEIGTLSGPGFTPGVLNNYLVVGGENPPVDCVPGDALCTEHPIDPPETTTTVPPTTTTTPPVTTEPCVPPTTTTRMVPTTTVATTTASATTAGDADVTGTEESTAEETTTEETTTEEVVAEEIVDPCGVTTTTPPTTTPPVTTVPPTTTVPNTTVPVTPTIIIPPIVVVPPIVVPPTVPGQPVPSTVPGQPKPPTANPGQPGQPKPSAPQGGTINSGGGAGESGVNTGLLAAGGLVLLLALGTGVVLLTRKRREDGDN